MDVRRPVSLLAVALVLAGAAAWANEDHERARAAGEAGKLVSFRAILERVTCEELVVAQIPNLTRSFHFRRGTDQQKIRQFVGVWLDTRGKARPGQLFGHIRQDKKIFLAVLEHWLEGKPIGKRVAEVAR